MGGEDWQMWIEALDEAGVLADGVRTVAYTYIGPEVTHPVYRDGTIGHAKNHLENTAKALDEYLQARSGSAHISVNKAMVTQSSAAIPVVPLYISLLYKVMKEKGCHESCIEQMHRLFAGCLYADASTDAEGRIRIDDREMREDVQREVAALWEQVNTENLESLSDIESYRSEFLGFSALALRALTTRRTSIPSGGCNRCVVGNEALLPLTSAPSLAGESPVGASRYRKPAPRRSSGFFRFRGD